jgi:glycosyltransferase involved in cell wall biosynthesis
VLRLIREESARFNRFCPLVTADRAQTLFAESAPGSDLMVRLDTRLPSVPVGRGTAVFCSGAVFHRRQAVRGLKLLVDGVPQRLAASRMPRLDLFQMLHPGLALGKIASTRHDSNSRVDPEVRCYRSGFWATIRISARDLPGTVELSAAVRLGSGSELVSPLGRLEVVEAKKSPSYDGLTEGGDRGLIAVCMATFDPDPALFRAQIASLRAQTDRDWICLLSDDCSRPERFKHITDTLAGDARFVVSRSPRNLGYYRNFERALEMVPSEADLVALCDQDDRWHPEKLQVLRSALGSAQLVYSDQRLVDADGRLLRETLWRGRRNNHTDFASLLIANTVTGAAMLFRREVAEMALPFPETPGWQFHDHWLALVAMAMGDIAYVDRPLYDYVQHEGAILGQVAASNDSHPNGRKRYRQFQRLRGLVRGWRAAYFYGYLAHEVQAQALLARCSTTLTAAKHRILERFVASQHEPLALAWLAARPLRSLVGANETLGTESELVRGIVWRHLVEARTGRREVPFGSPHDATCPPLDADNLGQNRIARWRSRL